MTPEQQQSAEAWAHVFGDHAATTRVIDDMTLFANGLSESQQPGATRLLLYILTKRSQLRRSKQEPKGRTKT